MRTKAAAEPEFQVRAGVLAVRKRLLPTGRAVLGGFLVAAAAVIVFAFVISNVSHQGQPVVVAARALPAGTQIGPGDTKTETVDLPSGTRELAFQSEAVVIGRALAVAATPGELLQSPMLEPAAGVSRRPVSISVDPTSLAGLERGAAVDVLATPSDTASASDSSSDSGSGSSVSVILRGATLMAVDDSGSGTLAGSTSGAVATLGVTSLSDAEALVQAAHSGTVTLVQAEPSDGVGAGPGA